MRTAAIIAGAVAALLWRQRAFEARVARAHNELVAEVGRSIRAAVARTNGHLRHLRDDELREALAQ